MKVSYKLEESLAIRVSANSLKCVITELFQKMGVPKDDAIVASEVIVMADLRGVDSHGVSNMLRVYLDRYNDGTQNPHPDWHITKEKKASANINGDRGLGIILAPKAMQIAIDKAKENGVGVVTMFNSGHLGMAAYHAMLALPYDMIGMCMTATSPSVLPTFGRIPRLGTNPIAIAAPAKFCNAWVFDMATSVAPVNKIRNARRMGTMLPGGTIADKYGSPLMEPSQVPDDFNLLPLGTNRDSGSHKGYGLAVAVDILCSVLAGSDYGIVADRSNYRQFFAAYNIDAFSDVDVFKQNMDSFITDLKSTPPAPDCDNVLVAGDPEWQALEDRSSNGIPLHAEVITWLQETCVKYEIKSDIEILNSGRQISK